MIARIVAALLAVLLLCGATGQQLFGIEDRNQYYSNLSLGLHCDGANGGTTFTDSSSYAQSLSRSGTTTSTTQIKYGTASCSFTRASGMYLYSNTGGQQFNFATGDLTISVWIYGAQDGGGNGIFTTAPASNGGPNGLAFHGNGTNAFYVYKNWALVECYWNPTEVAGQWNHLALVRTSGSFKFFYNGVEQSKTVVNENAGTSYGRLDGRVGQFYSDNTLATTYGLNSLIDDLQVYKGIALWTSNFTPPARSFAP